MGVQVEIRSLELGDVLWIAKYPDGRELVLGYVVERKTLKDLASSIVDGRYKEQKYRLSNGGFENVIHYRRNILSRYRSEIYKSYTNG